MRSKLFSYLSLAKAVEMSVYMDGLKYKVIDSFTGKGNNSKPISTGKPKKKPFGEVKLTRKQRKLNRKR